MPGVVSWRGFRHKGWVLSRTCTCEICCGQNDIGTGFCSGTSLLSLLPVHHCPIGMGFFFFFACFSYQKGQWRSLRMAWKVLSLFRRTVLPLGHELRPMKEVYDLNVTSTYDWYFVFSDTSITNHKSIYKKRKKFIKCVTYNMDILGIISSAFLPKIIKDLKPKDNDKMEAPMCYTLQKFPSLFLWSCNKWWYLIIKF